MTILSDENRHDRNMAPAKISAVSLLTQRFYFRWLTILSDENHHDRNMAPLLKLSIAVIYIFLIIYIFYLLLIEIETLRSIVPLVNRDQSVNFKSSKSCCKCVNEICPGAEAAHTVPKLTAEPKTSPAIRETLPRSAMDMVMIGCAKVLAA